MEKTLHLLVKSLRKEEIRHFRLLQERYKLGSDRKDMALFTHLHKSTRPDDERILVKLYGEENHNTYYRLSNRLKEQVEKSLLFQHFGSSPLQLAISFYQLHLHFSGAGEPELAMRYLRKSEQKAVQVNAFELLEMIYTAYIRMAQEESEDPAEYIRKRREARERHLQVQQLDDVLSILKHRIRISQNFSGKKHEVLSLMENTLREVTGNKSLAEDRVIYFKIYEGVSRVLLSEKDFGRLETYLKASYNHCLRKQWFDRQNHEIKLQMLTYLVNASFKNSKYRQALEYCQWLKEGIEEHNGLLREKFLFYYYNGLVNTYAIIDQSKTIAILEEAIAIPEVSANAMNALFLHLQLALQYFNAGEHKPAARQLQRVYLNDGFERLDPGFRLKIKMLDMLMRYNLRDFDNLQRLVAQSRKDFRETLADDSFIHEKSMLEILSGLESGRKKRQQEAIESARTLFQVLSQEEADDSRLVDYRAWLRDTFRFAT